MAWLLIVIVEDLILQIFLLDGICVLQKAIGEGTLAVINVSYDTKVTYVLHVLKGFVR